MQIYRIFGLIRQLHATPLVTVLMKQKTSILYRRMWEKVNEALLTINLVSNISFANFDAEVADYTTSVKVFRESVSRFALSTPNRVSIERVMLQDEDKNEGNAQAAAARPMNQQVPEEDVHENVWFSPLANHTKASKSEVVKRVVSMADTASICAKNKPCTRDSGVFFGAKKLAEAIVDCVLALDLKIAEDKRKN
uniref:Uncharacterized protein n=1 Tax=Ditylenchus dipsaci TaxID=166011 RepID=A0A915DB69_9BILA